MLSNSFFFQTSQVLNLSVIAGIRAQPIKSQQSSSKVNTWKRGKRQGRKMMMATTSVCKPKIKKEIDLEREGSLSLVVAFQLPFFFVCVCVFLLQLTITPSVVQEFCSPWTLPDYQRSLADRS